MTTTDNGTALLRSKSGIEILYDPESGWSNEFNLAGVNSILEDFELALQIPPAVTNPLVYLIEMVAEEFDFEVLALPKVREASNTEILI